MQEKYNVGIYCRLSRDDERTGESVSIENQKIMLSRYVQEQGWNLYAAYCDDGVSGTTFDRPMFNQMIADARAGKINLILCKDLSRLGRDYIEAGRYTDIVFPSMGCRFIALNDGVDTIHKNNEMLVILKNVMNDLYARDTSSKIRAVKQSTFKSGKYVGCYAPIGYRKSPADKHILEIDPVTAPVVLRIFDMRLQGDSFRKIARTLNEEGVPSPRGFYYLKNHAEEFAELLVQKTTKDYERESRNRRQRLQELIARNKEVDRLFERIYEDNVSGKLTDDRFMKMSQRYDEEQQQLKKDIEELQRQCDQEDNRAFCKEQFLKAVRKFMEMKTLTPTILHELVERIDVYQTQGTGKNRTQRIVIHYNFIGILDMPEVEEYPDNVVLDSRQGVAVEYLVGKAG